MPMKISITGSVANVRWGYHLAATLRDWSVSFDVITARVEAMDAFRISQSPLTLEIPNVAPEPPTRRRLEGVQIMDGGRFGARLGPKE